MLICHGAIRSHDAGLALGLEAPPGARLVVVDAGALAGLASFFANEGAHHENVEALALAHNDLLCRFAARGDVAPLRLDRVYADAAALREILLGDAERLARLLDGIAGRVEFFARICAGAPVETAPARTGADYLRARGAQRGAAARGARADFVNRVFENFGRCCDSVRPLTPQAAGAAPALARFALLAPRENFAELDTETMRLMAQAETLGLRLDVSGPWAPYVFTAEEGGYAGAA